MAELFNLKKLRVERGFTQDDVANFLNIARASYTNIENGKRETNFETLSKLADYFNVSTDYLLGKTDTPNPQLLEIPEILKDARIAFYRGEFDGLTQNAVDRLAEFAEFMKAKREAEENK